MMNWSQFPARSDIRLISSNSRTIKVNQQVIHETSVVPKFIPPDIVVPFQPWLKQIMSWYPIHCMRMIRLQMKNSSGKFHEREWGLVEINSSTSGLSYIQQQVWVSSCKKESELGQDATHSTRFALKLPCHPSRHLPNTCQPWTRSLRHNPTGDTL
jgi:hypothetical protein